MDHLAEREQDRFPRRDEVLVPPRSLDVQELQWVAEDPEVESEVGDQTERRYPDRGNATEALCMGVGGLERFDGECRHDGDPDETRGGSTCAQQARRDPTARSRRVHRCE